MNTRTPFPPLGPERSSPDERLARWASGALLVGWWLLTRSGELIEAGGRRLAAVARAAQRISRPVILEADALIRTEVGRTARTIRRALLEAYDAVHRGAGRSRRELPELVTAVQRGVHGAFIDAGTELGALLRAGRPLVAETAGWLRRGPGPARRTRTGSGGDRRVHLPRLRWIAAGGVTAVVLTAWLLPGPTLRAGAQLAATEVDDEGLPPLEEPSHVVGSDGEVMTLLPGGPNRDIVPIDEIPEILQDMVLVVEDRRFWDHDGWDTEGMVRAAVTNIRAGDVQQGGSTITQQLAKQNFTDGDRTMLRKGRELLYAVALEEHYDKRELLEHYLNQVYLGARTYGVAAAAHQYFGVELAEVTPDQAALLAGLIQSPGALDPRTNPEAAERRRNAVLSLAGAEGVVDPAEAEALRAAPMELAPPPSLVVQEPLIAEAVRRQLLTEPALGETREEREELLATGGLRIETTIDPRLQEAATVALFGALGRWEGLGTGLAAVDPHSGRIVAAASLSPEGTRSFDLATQGRRQPGSTYKTVAAIAAIEAGMPPDERLVGDGPTEIEYAPGRHWTVDNYSGSNHGRISLGEALTSSVNTAFAQVAVAVGTDRIVDVTERLGIDVEPALGPAAERGPSLALGALHHGVSPLEMASAYGVFATNGLRVEPYIVDRVVDRDGRELLRRETEPEPAVDPAVISVVRDMLTDAVRSGTGRAADLPGWEVAGKTGTSQQHADAWFVGTVPTLSVATWIGHPDASQPVRGLTGGGAAAPIWHDFMGAALDGVEPVPFPEPPWPLEIDEEPPELPETRRPRS